MGTKSDHTNEYTQSFIHHDNKAIKQKNWFRKASLSPFFAFYAFFFS